MNEVYLTVDDATVRYDGPLSPWYPPTREYVDPTTGDRVFERVAHADVAVLSFQPLIALARSEDIAGYGPAVNVALEIDWSGSVDVSDAPNFDPCGSVRFKLQYLPIRNPPNWVTFGSRSHVLGDVEQFSVFALLDKEVFILRNLEQSADFELLEHEGVRYSIRIEGQCVQLTAAPTSAD